MSEMQKLFDVQETYRSAISIVAVSESHSFRPAARELVGRKYGPSDRKQRSLPPEPCGVTAIQSDLSSGHR